LPEVAGGCRSRHAARAREARLREEMLLAGALQERALLAGVLLAGTLLAGARRRLPACRTPARPQLPPSARVTSIGA